MSQKIFFFGNIAEIPEKCWSKIIFVCWPISGMLNILQQCFMILEIFQSILNHLMRRFKPFTFTNSKTFLYWNFIMKIILKRKFLLTQPYITSYWIMLKKSSRDKINARKTRIPIQFNNSFVIKFQKYHYLNAFSMQLCKPYKNCQLLEFMFTHKI